jgi:hypothetical protein
LGGRGRWIEFEASLAFTVRPYLQKKKETKKERKANKQISLLSGWLFKKV